jgi:hypothetical protein
MEAKNNIKKKLCTVCVKCELTHFCFRFHHSLQNSECIKVDRKGHGSRDKFFLMWAVNVFSELMGPVSEYLAIPN